MIKIKELPAAVITNAIQDDLHFRVPIYPKLIQELEYIFTNDNKIIFDGIEEIRVIKGKAVATLLPKLLPLLDGSRTIEEIANIIIDYSSFQIYQALVLLYTQGLLEDAFVDKEIDIESFDETTLAFMRRYCDTTRINRSGAEAMSNLLIKEVGVITSEKLTINTLFQNMNKIGIDICRDNSNYKDLSFIEGKSLIICIEKSENLDIDTLRSINDICAQKNVPWLLGLVNEEVADLIYIENKETPCFNCLDTLNKFQKHKLFNGKTSEDKLRFWTHIVLEEAVYYLSKIIPNRITNSLVNFDFRNFSKINEHYPFVPGCSCKPIKGNKPEINLNKAFIYENAVAFPSAHLSNPKSHQNHFKISNMELSRDFKSFKNALKTPLVDFNSISGSKEYNLNLNVKSLKHKLNLRDLSSILLSGSGIKNMKEQGTVKRWSPTGGNLGSTELYILIRDCEGLESGIYFYEAASHSLALLQSIEESSMEELLREIITIDFLPSLVVVTASNFARVQQKYGAFSIRILYLDAGVASTTMVEVAKVLGHETLIENQFNYNKLENILNLHSSQDIISNLLLF